MIKMKVEENLATPKAFVFDGAAVCTDEQLPGDCCWDQPILNNSLIQVEQGVNFGFQWSVSGCLVPLLKCSKWKIQLHFEKWGEPEFNLPDGIAFTKFVPVSGHAYNEVISLRPNTVSEGVYDVVAVIRLYDNAGNPVPVAGFAELGKIQFYEASAPTI